MIERHARFETPGVVAEFPMTVCLFFIRDLFHELFRHQTAFIDRHRSEQIAARQLVEGRHPGPGVIGREPFVVEVGALHRLQTLGGRNTDGLTNDRSRSRPGACFEGFEALHR